MMRQIRHPILWFLVFTYLLTFVGQSVYWYVLKQLQAGIPPGTPGTVDSPGIVWSHGYGFYLTNAGPSLVGLVMIWYGSGLAGLRRIAAQLVPWSMRSSWPILIAGLLLPLAIVLASSTIVGDRLESWSLTRYLYGACITNGIIGAGICEEIGWRGFALAELQKRYSALVSSLFVGAAWALWHWPNHFIAANPLTPLHALLPLAASIPFGMILCILYTWVYNSTGGNLFAVIVMHGATVVTPGPADSSGAGFHFLVLAIHLLIAIGLVYRFGAANLSQRQKVVSDLPNHRMHGSGGGQRNLKSKSTPAAP